MNPYQLALYKLVRHPYRWFLSPDVSGLHNVSRALDQARAEKKGLLLIANHISAWDPIFICSALNVGHLHQMGGVTFLGKRELFDRPWKQWIMSRLGCVNIRERTILRRVIQGLREGKVFFLFPEGCVSTDGQMGRDLGAVRFLAKHASFVVLPIRVRGIWGGFRNDWKNIAAGRRRFQVAFGKPVLLEKGDDPRLDAMAMIRDVSFGPGERAHRVPVWAVT
uniref:1-acyl-sn-glycerol-3-phosphate acyltransferase n=1 Tax=Desulfacinum infernum TaxID=35837 RepID=A0A832A4W0_9BACT